MSAADDLMAAATEAYNADSYGRALKLYLKATAGFVAEGRGERAASGHFCAGIVLQQMRKWRAAIVEFDQATPALRLHGKHSRAGDSAKYAAQCFDKLRQPEAENTHYSLAAECYEAAREDVPAANAWFNSGVGLMGTRDYGLAVERLHRARELYSRAGERTRAADSQVNIAESHRELGELAASASEYRVAHIEYLELGAFADAAGCAVSVADVERDRGNSAAALAMLDIAREYFATTDDLESLNGVDLMRSIVLSETGEHQQALSVFDVVTLPEEPDISAIDLVGVHADLMHAAGNVELALSSMLRVREEKRRIGDFEGVAGANLSLGSAYNTAGKREESATCYREAYAWFNANGFEREAVQAQLGLGIETKTTDTPFSLAETLRFELASRDYFRSTGDVRQEAGTEMAIGSSYLAIEDGSSALVHYERSRALFASLGSQEWAARALTNKSLVYLELARVETEQTTRAFTLRRGLSCALDAAIYFDAVRYSFTSQSARREWAQAAQVSTTTAFELAAMAGDARALADLITMSRSSGVLRPIPTGTAAPDQSDPVLRSTGRSLSAAAVTLLGATDAILPPPPIICGPSGRRVLALGLDHVRVAMGLSLSKLRQPAVVSL